MTPCFWIVGLGNPGDVYRGTRHNVGFALVDRLRELWQFSAWKSWQDVELTRGTFHGIDVMLVKPMAFMNVSGAAVQTLKDYFKLTLDHMIVIHDELDFPPGVVKVKYGGGHGGHKGVLSLITHLGEEFVRIRVGIGKPGSAHEGKSHVLSRFDDAELALMDGAIVTAMMAVETCIDGGVALAMNRCNSKVTNESQSIEGE